MKPDSEGLHPIANTANPSRVADIVFVHGLGGSSHSTWRHGKEYRIGHFFWPVELGNALPQCGIWSVGYPAGFTGLGAQGMIIEKRAGNLSDKLVNAGLGDRPIIFITHSMGGLVVKHLIVDSQTLPGEERKRIARCSKGIVFCGTPHRGSAFSNAARVFGKLGGGSQAHVDEMCANAEKLDTLHDKFVEWHRHNSIPIDSYAESRKLSLTRLLFFATDYGVVVPRASANPGIAGYEVHDSDDDHLTLVKPRDAQHNVYAGVLRFIKKVLDAKPSPPVVSVQQHADNTERPAQKIADTRLTHSADKLIGREAELLRLDVAWSDSEQHVLIIQGIGGEGKTSLVVDWVGRLAQRNFDGADYFDWSFYSQGTRDQTSATSEPFIAAALGFFGGAEGKQLADSAASVHDKADKLLGYLRARRTLLVLDGMEPLQYPPGPLSGQLRDAGMTHLLKGLAQNQPGLCITTTREPVADLVRFAETTAPELPLEHLSDQAGAALLQSLLEPKRPNLHKVTSTEAERIEIARAVKGHALTLRLLGVYIHKALRDVRRWREVDYAKADEQLRKNPQDPNARYGHAFKTISAYEQWFASNGQTGARQLAVLRLLGLFDRTANADLLAALRAQPAISGLTDPLVNLSQDEWSIVISELEECGLVSASDASPAETALDAHPLLREYFARQLREQYPEAFRAAHKRLYQHLCAETKEGEQPMLAALQPLYQAVAHGCLAGMQQQACDEVYQGRILRGNEFYSTKKLGAFGSDLGAVACFFDTPWSRVSPKLADADQAWLLCEVATRLRALGRLGEALEPMRAGLEMGVKAKKWDETARRASNLSELELMLGMLDEAVSDAAQSVRYADQSGAWDQRMTKRTTHADALHQTGRVGEAKALFVDAEKMQGEHQPDYRLLYSAQGFQYCGLLLAAAERAAWRTIFSSLAGGRGGGGEGGGNEERGDESLHSEVCRTVSERAAQTLQWAEQGNLSLLTIALDHLTLSRTALYAALLEGFALNIAHAELEHAVDGLHRAGQQHYLPLGLLTRAWLRMLENNPEGAKADLDEAMEIAERGTMPLHMADIYLHRARLFFRELAYPWNNEDGTPRSAKQDLAEARRLIEKHGYWRRKEELEDAEAVIGR